MYTASICEFLQRHLKPSRLAHVYGVRDLAVSLAAHYGEDLEKAELAALCHDMYKYLDVNASDQAVRALGLPEKYLGRPNLAHSQIAAARLSDYGITDPAIVAAVRYHTTGRPAMSRLEQILYLADGLEPSRQYPGIEDLRKAAFENLDWACYLTMTKTIQYVTSQGQDLDQDTVQAAQYYQQITKKENSPMENRELAIKVARQLDQKKASDVKILEIGEKSSFADFLILATGHSDRQVGALTDDVEDCCAEEDVLVRTIEGKNGSGWVLMDYGDMVVNIFTEEMRNKYHIEKVWGDCPALDWEE